ncbi:MAG: flagellar biosynthetic protein FliO [Deltaproteobacteria bacterium]|nr:flagellar biosynthetic protein FliO [Deltaproteobacteria bacterium]
MPRGLLLGYLSGMFLAQSWQNYGIFILETLVALAAIALAAWGAVRIARARMGSRGETGRLRIIERLPLEPRRAVYLIEADGRTMLIGSSEGSLRLIEDLGPAKTNDSTEDEKE